MVYELFSFLVNILNIIYDESMYQFCKTLLSDKTIAVPSPIKDRIRANLLRQMTINWIQDKSLTRNHANKT